MRAVDQWRQLEQELPEGWEEARLSFAPEDPAARRAAAAALAPLGPGRLGGELRFGVRRTGAGSPEALRNLLRRLDEKRVWGTLSLVDVRAPSEDAATALVARSHEVPPERGSLVAAWDEAIAKLPGDWRDLLCELELDSSDFLPRAALLGAPLNPTRNPAEIAFRFRVSRRGYGVSTAMARRCLERMDGERITGRVSVLKALSQTDYVATQGPVWRIAGRSV